MALYAVSETVLGEWKLMGNPCMGPGADSTYQAQSSFVLPIRGKNGKFIFMADRWNKTNLEDSRYVWLPMSIRNGKPEIQWAASWTPRL
jgi:hypothetical protein